VKDSRRIRSHAEVSGRPGRGQKRSGRPWERAEEAGRHGKVMVHYKQFWCNITPTSQLQTVVSSVRRCHISYWPNSWLV